MKTLILILAAFVLSSIAYSEVDEDCWCVPQINPNYSLEDNVDYNIDSIIYLDTCGLSFSKTYRSCDSIFYYHYNYSEKPNDALYAIGAWRITFAEKVIDIPAYSSDTLLHLRWQEIDTSYAEIRKHFREISEWYGTFYLKKTL